MGIELVVLYCVYAVVGGTVLHTTISVTGDIVTASKEANAEKYVACQQNQKNDASSCKGLE
jgi:hypothetical protein